MWIRTSSYIILFSVSDATTVKRVVAVLTSFFLPLRNLLAGPRCVMTKSLVRHFTALVNVATKQADTKYTGLPIRQLECDGIRRQRERKKGPPLVNSSFVSTYSSHQRKNWLTCIASAFILPDSKFNYYFLFFLNFVKKTDVWNKEHSWLASFKVNLFENMLQGLL